MKRSSHQVLSRYLLRLGPSPIHRIGVFARQSIPPGVRVIEYTGQKLTKAEAARRFFRLWSRNRRRPIYFAALSRRCVIDGSVGGSGAEFVNHSCNPNLEPRRFGRRLWFVSRRTIRRGQELTIDYAFPADGSRVPCRCGSPKCRGRLNLLPGHPPKRLEALNF